MIWWLLATMAGSTEPDGTPAPGSPHYDLEELYGASDLQQALTRAKVRLRSTPDDTDLLWMKVRLMYEIGEGRADDHTWDRVAWYKEMVDDGKKAYRLDNADPRIRFWLGAAMARLGSTRGVLRSLFMANTIREHFEAAAEPGFQYRSVANYQRLPCDGYHALGIFYRLVPDRAIARALTGTRKGLDQSLSYHLRATKCEPRSLEYTKELAVTQLCLGERRDDPTLRMAGLQSLERASELPARTDRDKLDKRHIERLKANPSTACGYGRDAQQEVER